MGFEMRIKSQQQLDLELYAGVNALCELLLLEPYTFFSGASSTTIGLKANALCGFWMPTNKRYWRKCIARAKALGLIPEQSCTYVKAMVSARNSLQKKGRIQ
jgi:hypothetical protein